jgi:hypothetical protein
MVLSKGCPVPLQTSTLIIVIIIAHIVKNLNIDTYGARPPMRIGYSPDP